MSFDNDSSETTGMTTKVISLVVAIVVFATVLTPICASLAGGGGGGGGGQTYTVTNDGPLFALTEGDSGTHTVVAKTIFDENDESDEGTIVMLVDDEIVVSMPYDGNTENPQEILVGFGSGVGYEHLPHIDGEPDPGLRYYDIDVYYVLTDWATFRIDIYGTITNGDYAGYQYMTSMTNSCYDNEQSWVIENGQWFYDTGYAVYPIDLYRSDSGTYVYTDSAKVIDDTKVYTCKSEWLYYIPDDDESEDSISITSKGTISQLDDNMRLFGWYDGNESEWQSYDEQYTDITATLDMESGEYYQTLDSFDVSYYLATFDSTTEITIDKFFVPATITYSEGGSDSGSGGIDGPAGIIVGLIPVFVVLALLIYALNLLGFVNISRPEEIE